MYDALIVVDISHIATYNVAMYIERVPNRNSPPAVLLRESYREGGKVKKRTLANLSSWPAEKVEALKAVLKGKSATAPALEDAFHVDRSLPHGHVAAVLGTLRQIGLHKTIACRRSRERDLVVAMVASRLVIEKPCSKLATARALHPDIAANSLGHVLDLGVVDEDELYAALDWLEARQGRIEKKLADRHLQEGVLVLYDVTSVYFEGRTCELAKLGYSRDKKKGKLQIVCGLLCSHDGCPVAVEVFEGNTADPSTLATQVQKVRDRFGLTRVVFVGDRGMLTTARINEELRPIEGLDWVSSLRAPQVRKLVESGSLQPSLFDQTDLAEISHPDFPGERLVACRNPLLAAERKRKRAEMLDYADDKLAAVQAATQREKRALKGRDKIGVRVGRALAKTKMGKHYRYEIREDGFDFERDQDKIDAEAALDGIYVIRTSVDAEVLDAEASVAAYKGLSVVERAFRRSKTVDLHIRPIHHRLANRVRAHVFLCMLAYYVEWHMRKRLAPLLFDDLEPEAGRARRTSIVAPATRSPAALEKASSKQTADGYHVESFRSLLRNLGTLALNRIQPTIDGAEPFWKLTRPTPQQQRALDLLGVSLRV